MLAAVAFLISVSSFPDSDRRGQYLLAAAIGIPAVAYTNAVIWEVSSPSFYYSVIAAGLLAVLATVSRRYRGITLYAVLAGAVAVSLGLAVATHYDPDLGITYVLAGLNFGVAVLYLASLPSHQRGSPDHRRRIRALGIGVPYFGGSIDFLPSLKVDSEVWNIPKYLSRWA